MRRIEVAGPQPYTVTVGRGVLGQMKLGGAGEGRVALIHPSDLPAEWVTRAQSAVSPTLTLSVPPRDECKTLEVFASLLSQLAQAGLPRSSAVLGLGGGAATDLAGFVAASYLRGVAFYTAPTTLLGMVDAAVGGKTGVNLPEGKNLAGAFWPPRAVWCDLDTLASLPPHVFREGAAEMFKHGLIADPTLLPRVLAPDFGPQHPALEDTVADAIAVKAGIVSRDLTEQGERAFLNFGHTLAHALEGVTRQGIAHGEAVAYGMHYAARLSLALGGADLSAHTLAFLRWQQPRPLPTAALDFEALSTYMARDKKADSLGVRFVLLHDLARPYLARVPESVLEQEWRGWAADLRELGLVAD